MDYDTSMIEGLILKHTEQLRKPKKKQFYVSVKYGILLNNALSDEVPKTMSQRL